MAEAFLTFLVAEKSGDKRSRHTSKSPDISKAVSNMWNLFTFYVAKTPFLYVFLKNSLFAIFFSCNFIFGFYIFSAEYLRLC